jgi:hypothetical protein
MQNPPILSDQKGTVLYSAVLYDAKATHIPCFIKRLEPLYKILAWRTIERWKGFTL